LCENESPVRQSKLKSRGITEKQFGIDMTIMGECLGLNMVCAILLKELAQISRLKVPEVVAAQLLAWPAAGPSQFRNSNSQS